MTNEDNAKIVMVGQQIKQVKKELNETRFWRMRKINQTQDELDAKLEKLQKGDFHIHFKEKILNFLYVKNYSTSVYDNVTVGGVCFILKKVPLRSAWKPRG